MPHFELWQWIDFARGLEAEAWRTRMRQHLAFGCLDGDLQARTARALAALAAAAPEPPVAVVRAAKALFGRRRPVPASARVLPVRLVFDSLAPAARLGVRGPVRGARHMVFYTVDYALDLRMDQGRKPGDLLLMGQIVSRRQEPVPGVPALLMSDTRVLSRALTGALGEFSMQCAQEGPLKLCLRVSAEESIEVSLDQRDGTMEALPER